MQPRYTEQETLDRPLTPPKAKPAAARNSEKTADRPRDQRPQKQVELHLNSPQARSVCVAGSFNNWDQKKTPLQKEGNAWKASLALPPGRYEYRFIVDGQWISDPNARESVRNDYGSTNCVLVV